jgi:hypothetical protein
MEAQRSRTARQSFRVELISQWSSLDPIWMKMKGIEEQLREILTTAIREKSVEIWSNS